MKNIFLFTIILSLTSTQVFAQSRVDSSVNATSAYRSKIVTELLFESQEAQGKIVELELALDKVRSTPEYKERFQKDAGVIIMGILVSFAAISIKSKGLNKAEAGTLSKLNLFDRFIDKNIIWLGGLLTATGAGDIFLLENQKDIRDIKVKLERARRDLMQIESLLFKLGFNNPSISPSLLKDR